MAEKIWIALCGCDDTTRFQIDVTPEERAFVERLCAASKEASTYICQQTMECGPESKPMDVDNDDD